MIVSRTPISFDNMPAPNLVDFQLKLYRPAIKPIYAVAELQYIYFVLSWFLRDNEYNQIRCGAYVIEVLPGPVLNKTGGCTCNITAPVLQGFSPVTMSVVCNNADETG